MSLHKERRRGPRPSYSLAYPVASKTITHVIPADPAVEVAQKQLQEYHRFRDLVQQLITVSEQICDLQLQQSACFAGCQQGTESSRG